MTFLPGPAIQAVSYTHLDVYKRQSLIYPDYDYESYESDEWLNSQENDLNDPILPLPEDQDAWTGQELSLIHIYFLSCLVPK